MDLPVLVQEIQVEFTRNFTVGAFIEELKLKMRELDQQRKEKVLQANLEMINSYSKEIEAGLGTQLYEFALTLKKKTWR